MAGGGQVTEAVFTLIWLICMLLGEGRTIEFQHHVYGSLFVWGLVFGSQRIVSKKRASGAPITALPYDEQLC